ncbi:MAG: hypothetical protein EXR72_15795 [Myxococcales bacterium]|nr:hypothetical protein [Myxococcales bacterium]
MESVIIGGVAAVLHGAPVSTFDFDLAYHRSDDNIARLLAALDEMGAEFVLDLAHRHLRPTAGHLATAGPKLLATRLGRLDLLGEVSPVPSWEALCSDAVTMLLADQVPVRVVSLDRLIEIKRWLADQNLPERGGRDRLHLHQLEAVKRRLSEG